MSLKTEVGKIKLRLLKNKWIIPSKKTSMLLVSVVKKQGIDNFTRALEYLETTDYVVHSLNDITSKITILYIASLCHKIPDIREKEQETRHMLDLIIKEVLND